MYHAYASSHYTINLHVQFEVSGFTRSKDMMGPAKLKINHVTLTMPICSRPSLSPRGWHFKWPTCVQKLTTLASVFPEIRKKTQNVNLGVNWGDWVIQGHRQCHCSIERIRLPVHISRKLCVYLVLFSRYSELFVESRSFSYSPSVYLASPFSGEVESLGHRASSSALWYV